MFNPKPEAAWIQKWGGIASFLMAATIIASGLIYLTGNLREAMGPLAYSLADFLYGPVWAATLVSTVIALRERIGAVAPRRMNLALLAALAAGCALVAVASIRAANRHYHLIHPELHLELSSAVLTVWTTLVAGAIGAGLHFLGWALVLIGSAGWTSRRFPRILSGLYLLAGAASLLVFILPDMEASALAFIVIVSIWQGFLLLKGEPRLPQSPEINPIQPDET